MKKEPIIKLVDVWKIYQMGAVNVEALRGLSFEVFPGEFVSVQGPSGSGKSTTMNMIGALDYPTKGKIFLDSRDISHLSESSLAQLRGRKIGFVFQQFNLISSLTALENVALPMLFQGVSPGERRRRAVELLSAVGLIDRINHKPTELSGGQQQRVAIARALVNRPEVVLADEPTGNLDSATGESVIDFLEKLNNEGTTIVVVTHDTYVAHRARRVEFLKDGVIVGSKRR